MSRSDCVLSTTRLSFILAVCCLAVSCAPDGGQPAEQPSDAIVFEGARLISGDGSVPLESSVFIVENGQFNQVGPMGEIEVPEGATRIDLTGRTVMPAIIDAHKHVATTRDELIPQLEHFAYYGVGTVMSLGLDPGDLAFEVREETIPGAARLRTAGRGITSPEPGRSEVPYWVTTEEEARQAVRELAARDVDLVKLWVDDRDGAYEKLSPELYAAAIDEAHAAGLRVTAHIFDMADAAGLLEAGIDGFAHGVRDRDIDDAFVDLIRSHPEVVLTPNMADRGVAVDLSWLAGTIPPDELADLQAAATDRPDAQEFFGIQARNLDRLNQAGVKIAFGTDGAVPWAAHLEMEDMVAAGMTPAEVIVAATSTSAEWLGLSDVGQIESGRSADFIVLNANPLDDIRNTRQIDSVYLRGEAVERDAIGQRLRSSTE